MVEDLEARGNWNPKELTHLKSRQVHEWMVLVGEVAKCQVLKLLKGLLSVLHLLWPESQTKAWKESKENSVQIQKPDKRCSKLVESV